MFTVTIVYKNGYVHKDVFKSFKVTTQGSKLAEISWETCRYTKYNVLHYGVDDIMAVYSESYSKWRRYV